MFTARASEAGYQVYPLATLCTCTASELVPEICNMAYFEHIVHHQRGQL